MFPIPEKTNQEIPSFSTQTLVDYYNKVVGLGKFLFPFPAALMHKHIHLQTILYKFKRTVCKAG